MSAARDAAGILRAMRADEAAAPRTPTRGAGDGGDDEVEVVHVQHIAVDPGGCGAGNGGGQSSSFR